MVQIEIQGMDQLFMDVQMQRVFPDGKTFVDCLPKYPVEEIKANYEQQKTGTGFNLKEFVLQHFDLPVPHSNNYHSDANKPVEANIEKLWDILTRQPGKMGGTLIPLPYPYIVPGGRFGEIYYWDSFFTLLGIISSGREDMLESMVKNFSYLVDSFGYIPNGNRSYFIGRSQPPFYSLMVRQLASIKGNAILPQYLVQLEKEYAFWMRGKNEVNEKNAAVNHVTRLSGGEILNRYWDQHDTPRPESFREDIELSQESDQEPARLFRHLRAGAESGWDFSSRWFKDEKLFATIHTTDIIPVDLNCLLYHLEITIAEAYRQSNELEAEREYLQLAGNRKNAIQKYCWNQEKGFFFDYDHTEKKQKNSWTLAGAFPLYFKMASPEQAMTVAAAIESKFLKHGGLVSTLIDSGQQWDAPNGWAPLHWMTITGLENYGHAQLAKNIADRWIKLNSDVFRRTGKLMEKYNVVDTHLEAGGGEYEGQDGFGWTNGVLLTLLKKYGTS